MSEALLVSARCIAARTTVRLTFGFAASRASPVTCRFGPEISARAVLAGNAGGCSGKELERARRMPAIPQARRAHHRHGSRRPPDPAQATRPTQEFPCSTNTSTSATHSTGTGGRGGSCHNSAADSGSSIYKPSRHRRTDFGWPRSPESPYARHLRLSCIRCRADRATCPKPRCRLPPATAASPGE